jgi:anti-sigma28 factor (negative regulator of flagellin synthesis)
MVKDAPSINEEKIALIKKRVKEGTYLNSAMINEIVSDLSARL